MATKKRSHDEPATPPTDEDMLLAAREAMFRRARKRGQGFYVEAAADGVAMSEVLDRFVAPLREEGMSFTRYKQLLALGQAAWNAGLAPASQRQRLIGLAVGREAPRKNRQMLQYLLLRKESQFAAYTREIVDFQLADYGEDWYLSVLSSPEGKAVDEDGDAA